MLKQLVLCALLISFALARDPACDEPGLCQEKCLSQGHASGSCFKDFYNWSYEDRCKCSGDAACAKPGLCEQKCLSQGHSNGACYPDFYRWKYENRCKCGGDAIVISVLHQFKDAFEKVGGNVVEFCKNNPEKCIKAVGR